MFYLSANHGKNIPLKISENICKIKSIHFNIASVEQIKNHIFGIKVGLQYVTSTGIDGVKALARFNFIILLTL